MKTVRAGQITAPQEMLMLLYLARGRMQLWFCKVIKTGRGLWTCEVGPRHHLSGREGSEYHKKES